MKLYWAVEERAAIHAVENCYNLRMVGLPNLCSESITTHQSPPATPQQ